MNKIHRPDIIGTDSLGAVITQLRLHPPLGGLVAQLHPVLRAYAASRRSLGPYVNAINLHDVDAPAFTVEQDMDTAITIAHPRFADLLDPPRNSSLISAPEFVVKRRAVELQGPTSRSDRYCPIAAHSANKFARATKAQIFRRITSVRLFS